MDICTSHCERMNLSIRTFLKRFTRLALGFSKKFDLVGRSASYHDGWVKFPQGGCSCTFGRCTRLDPVEGDHDWYESCQPALERDGLAWFYFIPSVDCVATEFQERYTRVPRTGGRRPPVVYTTQSPQIATFWDISVIRPDVRKSLDL
jgi:hypothetical protein